MDHPRSRGVYAWAADLDAFESGSSPLARGLRPPDPIGERGQGIIPARAGFTRRRHRGSCRRGDHPRSRGVYGQDGGDAVYFYGSSPLARGLPEADRGCGVISRIIPARAGFTVQYFDHYPAESDHPRSRGVYASAPGGRRREKGSSPLARGLPSTTIYHVMEARIIPARAGFTMA